MKQVPLDAKRLEKVQADVRALDAVHVAQAIQEITFLYQATVGKLDDGDGHNTSQPLDDTGQTVDSSLRPISHFSSDFSPLTRQPGASETQLRLMASQFSGKHKSPLTEEIGRLSALLELAKTIDANGFAPVSFNQTGQVSLRAARSIVAKSESATPNDFEMDVSGESIKILTGPHGSGKTYYQKTIIPAVLMASTVGYAPAQTATMPLLDRVIYVDRVAQEPDAELSAGMQEIAYWQEALRATRTGGLVLAAVDEVGSSTSPKYQAAFIAAIAREFARVGHLLVMASHNHAAASVLTAASGGRAVAYNFETAVIGEDRFRNSLSSHTLTPGLKASDAISAAHEAGLPAGLLDTIAAW